MRSHKEEYVMAGGWIQHCPSHEYGDLWRSFCQQNRHSVTD